MLPGGLHFLAFAQNGVVQYVQPPANAPGLEGTDLFKGERGCGVGLHVHLYMHLLMLLRAHRLYSMARAGTLPGRCRLPSLIPALFRSPLSSSTDPEWRPLVLFGVSRTSVLTITGPVRLPNGGLALQATRPLQATLRPMPNGTTTMFGGPPGPYRCGAPCLPNSMEAGKVFWGYAVMSIDISTLARTYGNKDWATALSDRK
jgi:hypothetical protein